MKTKELTQNGGKAGEGNGESIQLLWTCSLLWVKAVNLVFFLYAAICSQGIIVIFLQKCLVVLQ